MDKNQALKKKLNEYTSQLTPGQVTKLDADQVQHYYKTYLDRLPDKTEIGIYQNHPDNKQLVKDLLMMRKNMEKKEKQQMMGQYAGEGGPIDNFGAALSAGASRIGRQISSQLGPVGSIPALGFQNLQRTPAPGPTNVSPSNFRTGATGMRTDRHNNPTAFITQIAEQAGLVPGVEWTPGDPFPNNPNLRTARLIGDPIALTIKVLDRIGFYTPSGKPRWTYVNSLPGINNWRNLNYGQKANIIAQMYRHEGGNGSLLRGGQGGPAGQGQGGPSNAYQQLGNLTTQFGEPTRDTNFHTGIDIANREGTPVPKLGPMPGKVESVGNNGSYGLQVAIRNVDGTKETYSHLRRSNVRPGQPVTPQQPDIAEMGKSGNSWSASGGDPSHLHYEIIDAYNRYQNPLNYLRG